MARGVERNFGSEWAGVLLEMCGVKVNPAKVRFDTLLDEFF